MLMAVSSSATNKTLQKGMSCGASTSTSKASKKPKRPSSAKGVAEEQGLFPVEKIIAERIVNGRVHFKIRWQGYSQDEDSWEPEENLGNVSDLIEVFRRNSCSNSKRLKFSGKRKSTTKSKSIGRYEYVPQSELVAPKTKYFDDVRDGKIDLTKNDMYSRVKTRKRLQFEIDGDFIDCQDNIFDEDVYHLQKCGMLEQFSPVSRTAQVSNVSTPTTTSNYTNRLLLDIGEIKSEYSQEQIHSPISSISTAGCETEDMPSSSSSAAQPPVTFTSATYSNKDSTSGSSSSSSRSSIPVTSSSSEEVIIDLPVDDKPVSSCSSSPRNPSPLDEESCQSQPEKPVLPTQSQTQVEDNKKAEMLPRPLSINTTQSQLHSSHRNSQTKKVQRVSPNNTVPTQSTETNKRVEFPASTGQSTATVIVPCEPAHNNFPKRENTFVCRPFVTSEKDLLRVYANKSSLAEWTPSQLPQLLMESDNVHCVSHEELVQAIVFNRWTLFERTVRSGQFSLNKIDGNGSPLIMTTIHRDRVAMLRLLLSRGASANIEEAKSGRTPLMLAAELGHLHAVKALLDYGAFSDQQNRLQESALSLAIQNGRLSVVEVLLAHGTNFYMVDPTHTAINLVTKLKNSRTVDTSTLSKIYDLIYEHHSKLTGAMRLSVNQYLAKLNLHNELVILPCQWISVMAGRFEIDINLTSRVLLESPILLLCHGRQCGANYHFWMEDGPCLVDRVLLNGKVQTPLRESAFVTTLHPMCPPSQCSRNRLLLEFVAPESILDREIRIAVLAIDVRSIDPTKSTAVSPLSVLKDLSV